MAAQRGVLRIRADGVARQPPDRERLPGGTVADPAAVLPRARQRAAQPRHRSHRSDGPAQRAQGGLPQAWTRTFGRGRTFYTALGHRDDIWAHDAVFRAHVTGGIRWALGLEE
jgi:hypothetical protein